MSQTIASWVRECDEENFQRFFAGRPGLALVNARTTSVDLGKAEALLLTGGPDIAGENLRQPVPDPALIEDAEPERDAWELQAAQDALARGLPILAVCKGAQLLNVVLGGTLHLDIAGHNLPEQKYGNLQAVRNGSGATVRFPKVNSSHHQALASLGSGLFVESWCAEDDIIEQVRLRKYPFALGVQYHPERDVQYAPLFEMLHRRDRKPASGVNFQAVTKFQGLMLIKVGYDISYEVQAPTPMVLMLYIHPSRHQDIRKPEKLVVEPGVPIEEFFDNFGNRCARIVAQPGVVRLICDSLVECSEEADPVDLDAVQHPVQDLPTHVLPYLLASRYCELEKFTGLAWDLFGHTAPGWGRVQAVCDWVHQHVTFGYQYARADKTSHEVLTEGRGVCRDFMHL